MGIQLNQNAARLCETLLGDAERFRVSVTTLDQGTRLVDCGIAARGGLEAGRMLAKICMADLGRVSLVVEQSELWPGLAVLVTTDHPIRACMASQYAGWEIRDAHMFAMGSGPMRAAAAREKLFEVIGFQERPDVAVGVLETGQFPTPELCTQLAEQCHVDPANLILLLAPTRSQAGTIQIAARSVETAMHKLHELNFDLARVESACGTAPLPPPAADDLTAIGRTNDAILYGGEVVLYVRGDDESLMHLGPQVPSCTSNDHGRPFAAVFQAYGGDFYKIDRRLFSPAVVNFVNLDTGRSHRFGHLVPRVIHESFGGAAVKE